MKDNLGNDPVEFELSVLIAKVEALLAVVAALPEAKRINFAAVEDSLRGSAALRRASENYKAVPSPDFALQGALEAVRKIQNAK